MWLIRSLRPLMAMAPCKDRVQRAAGMVPIAHGQLYLFLSTCPKPEVKLNLNTGLGQWKVSGLIPKPSVVQVVRKGREMAREASWKLQTGVVPRRQTSEWKVLSNEY